MARAYRFVSSDSHLEVLPERWTHRIPTEYRDRAPKTVLLSDGGDALTIDNDRVLQPANATDLRAGRPPGQWKPFGMRYQDAGGTGPPEQRVKEQETDGLDAEVLFPSQVAGPVFWRNIEDDDAYRATIRAYNDWLGEEYCAVAPERLIGLGILPWTNPDDMVSEMEHCARLGLKGVLLGVFPSSKGYPTPEDDKFWAAAVDMQMPVAVHVRLYRTGRRASDPTFQYPVDDPDLVTKVRRTPVDMMASLGLESALPISQLVLAGVFERFPALRVFFAETRLGWVPFWIEHADLNYRRGMEWAESVLGFKGLDRLPSEYIRDHIYWSIQYEQTAIGLRHLIGVDRIMFATDFPHIECEWPHSREIVDRLYRDVPEEERRKIFAQNVVRFFNLEALEEEPTIRSSVIV